MQEKRFHDGARVTCTDPNGTKFQGKVTGPTYLEDYVYPGYWVEVEPGVELTFFSTEVQVSTSN